MSIPVVVKHPQQLLPALDVGGLRYVVARNGLFLERASTMYQSSCRVESCAAGLAEHHERFEYRCPPIGAEMASEMLTFFRWAYRSHSGEAALILLYEPTRGTYRWHCPPQRVEMIETWGGRWYNRGDIEYTQPLELPPGYVMLGDAHSHADLAAYSSAVDQLDERHKDGLHIVIGRLHLQSVDVFAEFVMDGHRFAVDANAVLPSIARYSAAQTLTSFAASPAAFETDATDVRFPAPWMEQVEVVRRPYTHATYPSYRSVDRHRGWNGGW